MAGRGVTPAETVKVWLPDGPGPGLLEDLAGVELATVPAEPSAAAEVGDIEFFVPPEWPVDRIAAALAPMKGLRVIQTTSAGVEWILPHVPPGVTLCNARGVHDAPVAEWAVTVILAMERRLPELRDQQRAGRWGRVVGGDLAGKTVLTIGHGSIGRALETRLAPFGVRQLRIARRRREGVATMDGLDELLPEADVVVLLLPLTPETEGVVDERFLGRMKRGALLVNAARGRLVATEALRAALEARQVRAALDVTDPEPLPPDHPLWRAPDVLITPHVAGDTAALPERAFALVRDQIRRYQAGEPLANVVQDY